MSRRNVEIVRRAFSGDGSACWSWRWNDFDPGVVMTHVEAGPSEGLQAAREDFDDWASAWEEFEATPEEFLDAGERVLVAARFRGRGRASGVEVEGRFYDVFTLSDGRIVRVDEFAERADALEAAGVLE